MSNYLPRPMDKIEEIRAMFKAGQLSFDEAKTLALPLIQEIEASAEKVAERFGRTPPKFSFTALMR